MSEAIEPGTPRVMAGPPSHNMALYHRIRFRAGDPAAIIEAPGANARPTRTLIIRDVEVERASRDARADEVRSPADFTPAAGLSGDRETATAQATAEALRRMDVRRVIADRTLPLIFADAIERIGIDVECDLDMGVIDRRRKDEQEIEWLRESQRITERAMRMALELIAKAEADAEGVLQHGGDPLTSERVKNAIDAFLIERSFSNPRSIVAQHPNSADCHDDGSGPLRTGLPTIIDIFPQSKETLYYGDCTRVVVHGDIPDEVAHMHEAVVTAKAAAIEATSAGVTGADVHDATRRVIESHGYTMGLPPENAPDDFCSMQHGTGHGLGLDVHEPPLIDTGGPELLEGDAVTIEPGLYSRKWGGIRIEDLVIVTKDGCENLNTLPEGMTWA